METEERRKAMEQLLSMKGKIQIDFDWEQAEMDELRDQERRLMHCSFDQDQE